MNSRAPFLSRPPLFADVAPETIARVEQRTRGRDLGARAMILREGGSNDSALLVLSGCVAACRKEAGLADPLDAAATLAMTNPSNIVAFDDVRRVIGCA
ncbi:MAG TPA: hypothetical protein VGC23_04045 [Vicinamibacterales bacterium]